VAKGLRNRARFKIITAVRAGIVEICALLEYYAAFSGNSWLTFRDKPLVKSSKKKSQWGIITIRWNRTDKVVCWVVISSWVVTEISELHCLSFEDLNSSRRTSILTNVELYCTENMGISSQVTAGNHYSKTATGIFKMKVSHVTEVRLKSYLIFALIRLLYYFYCCFCCC